MAGTGLESFCPNVAATVTVACTTTSGSTRVALVGGNARKRQVVIQSDASSGATAFVEFGSSTISAATATGFPIQAGAVLSITVPPDATHVAGITASSTATVYVTTGEGD